MPTISVRIGLRYTARCMNGAQARLQALYTRERQLVRLAPTEDRLRDLFELSLRILHDEGELLTFGAMLSLAFQPANEARIGLTCVDDGAEVRQ